MVNRDKKKNHEEQIDRKWMGSLVGGLMLVSG